MVCLLFAQFGIIVKKSAFHIAGNNPLASEMCYELHIRTYLFVIKTICISSYRTHIGIDVVACFYSQRIKWIALSYTEIIWSHRMLCLCAYFRAFKVAKVAIKKWKYVREIFVSACRHYYKITRWRNAFENRVRSSHTFSLIIVLLDVSTIGSIYVNHLH